jgi:hypothetical protein
MTPVFYMPCRNGKLQINANFQKWLDNFDGIVRVVVDKPKNKRSLKQNSFLWGVVYKLISEETGYNTDQIHALMKQMFGEKETVCLGRVPISTTKYTVEQFSEYWEKIQRWAAEFLDLHIPDPEKVEA